MADDAPSWLTLTEAAQASGLPRETIRSRARRGLIPSQRGNRGELLVQLTAVEGRPDHGTNAAMTAPVMTAPGQAVVIADLTAEVAELREKLARAEERAEAARAIAGAEMAALRALADELRRQLELERARLERELALARRPWWRRLLG